jgi:hypothetical protein
MRGTVPIITCDSEYGCDNWVIDNYELGAKEWREIMRGWTYEPYKDRDAALCPEHKDEVDQ